MTTVRKPRAPKPAATDLTAPQLRLDAAPPEVAALAAHVEADGGAVLTVYREPIGGHPLLLVALPVERVERPAFQRDVSETHVRRLTVAMDTTRRYLDPIIVVRDGGRYLTPNGGHRLTALRELGARAVVALLVPERRVAWQILALNIEKAHNLREKAVEVVRMYRDLAPQFDLTESDLALEFEEPALVTLGFAYERRPRVAGSAYHALVRRVDGFLPLPLRDGVAVRERRADALLALDDAVTGAVARLRAHGFESPYLRNFVVARVQPARASASGAAVTAPAFDDALAAMAARAEALDPAAIREADLARTGPPPDEAGTE